MEPIGFEVVTGVIVTRWANLRLNLTSGPCTLAAIWDGPSYDADLETLRSKCQGLNQLLKESIELSNRNHQEWKQQLQERSEPGVFQGES